MRSSGFVVGLGLFGCLAPNPELRDGGPPAVDSADEADAAPEADPAPAPDDGPASESDADLDPASGAEPASAPATGPADSTDPPDAAAPATPSTAPLPADRDDDGVPDDRDNCPDVANHTQDPRACDPTAPAPEPEPKPEPEATYLARLRLDWDAAGANLDLHLVRPGGEIFAEDGDLCWFEPTPRWGLPGLDESLTAGEPETITLAAPAPGRYLVDVMYGDVPEGEPPPARATLGIECGGVSQVVGSMDFDGPTLRRGTGLIWQAAWLTLPDCQVEVIGPAERSAQVECDLDANECICRGCLTVGACEANADCSAGRYCDLLEHTCHDTGGGDGFYLAVCETDDECAEGFVCGTVGLLAQRCTMPCDTTADCRNLGQCRRNAEAPRRGECAAP